MIFKSIKLTGYAIPMFQLQVQTDEHVLELQAKVIELECLLEETKKKLQLKENVEAQLQQAVAQHKAAASYWEQQKTALEEVNEVSSTSGLWYIFLT